MLNHIRTLLSRDASTYYEIQGDDVPWMNLGYWKTARTYPEAAAALAMLLAEAARLGPGDRVLDVGFGFGDQDLLWIDRSGVEHITGLNITELHVRKARARVEARGLGDRVDLRRGSATKIRFAEGSFHKVVTLESAFHFDTRARFFEQAFHVLRPGGRIALADLVRRPGAGPLTFKNKLICRLLSIPLANVYDRHEYVRKLAATGFEDIQCESIIRYVRAGTLKYRKLLATGIPFDEIVIDVTDEEMDARTESTSGLSDYIIVSARKPVCPG
jgi:microcystin synthetase protein McyJ